MRVCVWLVWIELSRPPLQNHLSWFRICSRLTRHIHPRTNTRTSPRLAARRANHLAVGGRPGSFWRIYAADNGGLVEEGPPCSPFTEHDKLQINPWRIHTIIVLYAFAGRRWRKRERGWRERRREKQTIILVYNIRTRDETTYILWPGYRHIIYRDTAVHNLYNNILYTRVMYENSNAYYIYYNYYNIIISRYLLQASRDICTIYYFVCTLVSYTTFRDEQ